MIFARFVLCALLGVSAASATAKEVLRWGVDVESGAPFSFKDPKDPSKVIGFEADIVQAIAGELGMDVQYVQNNWEGLVEGLKRHDYDLVINGIEITKDREQVVNFSRPYYVTHETLTVQANNQTITKLEDLQGRRVGTLSGALSQRILKEQTFPMEVVSYAEEIYMYNDLMIGRTDAVLLDHPVALYYAGTNHDLKNLAQPIGRIEYGAVTRKEDRELARKVDAAIAKLIAEGTLRDILERWALWNPLVAKAWGQDPSARKAPEAYHRFLESVYSKPGWKERMHRYISFMPLLIKGAVMTLKISILAMIVAIGIGLLTALARLYGPWPLSFSALAFVEIFRGTPLLIQLFLIFYGLPSLGIRLDPFMAAVLGLGLNYGACEAENYRAGILSIPKSQMDASLALGLSRWQSLQHIVLPQAMRVVIPPVTNDFIALLKDSSLVSIITMVELTSTYGQLASTYFDYLGIGLLTAAFYFLIGLPFVRLSRYFEGQLNSHLKIRGTTPHRVVSPVAMRALSASAIEKS